MSAHQYRPWVKPILKHTPRKTGYVTQAMLDYFGSREAALRYLNDGGQMFSHKPEEAA